MYTDLTPRNVYSSQTDEKKQPESWTCAIQRRSHTHTHTQTQRHSYFILSLIFGHHNVYAFNSLLFLLLFLQYCRATADSGFVSFIVFFPLAVGTFSFRLFRQIIVCKLFIVQLNFSFDFTHRHSTHSQSVRSYTTAAKMHLALCLISRLTSMLFIFRADDVVYIRHAVRVRLLCVCVFVFSIFLG